MLYPYLKFLSDLRVTGEKISDCGFCVGAVSGAGPGTENVTINRRPAPGLEELAD